MPAAFLFDSQNGEKTLIRYFISITGCLIFLSALVLSASAQTIPPNTPVLAAESTAEVIAAEATSELDLTLTPVFRAERTRAVRPAAPPIIFSEPPSSNSNPSNTIRIGASAVFMVILFAAWRVRTSNEKRKK